MVVSTEAASLLVSGASVIFAAALTFVTYLYYRETKRQTNEMEATREADFKPVITPSLMISGPLSVYFAFENTGNGAAHNVSALWKITGEEVTEEWTSSLVSSGERHEFFLPIDSDDVVVNIHQLMEQVDDNAILTFEATYDDALGNTITDSRDLDVQEILSGRVETGEMTGEDEYERIISELSDISKELGSVGDSVEENNLTRIELTKSILDILEAQGQMTVGELSSLLSLEKRAVERQLSGMSDAGMITLEGDEPSPFNSDTIVSLES